ncbi:MAG: glycerol-3-phosphate 1-O-acyltransferase PlsY [Planctomycetes bacterium]|nr:glycerol-3-phosphate 1-O-acyltransferase PlsY [Planctomycetota bacterium]
MIYYYIICAVVGYLIGSIPFGYIIVKLRKGIDIRTVGSGNIGATNVVRIAGLPWGILCFLLDAAKGFLPTLYVIYNLTCSPRAEIVVTHGDFGGCTVIEMTSGAIIGLSLIIGHLFPVYIRFRGGKGVATALGVFLALTPEATIVSFIIWLVLFSLFRYVSVASIMAAVSLPISFGWITQSKYPIRSIWEYYYGLFIVCIIVAILVIIKHIPNIKRLIKGTEPKVRLWGRKAEEKLQ